ncbi:MAG: hypothetical protein IIY87_07535 [Bacteroidales bacterium]|nr:hypothetical protein [Bacteroidales bacterium]
MRRNCFNNLFVSNENLWNRIYKSELFYRFWIIIQHNDRNDSTHNNCPGNSSNDAAMPRYGRLGSRGMKFCLYVIPHLTWRLLFRILKHRTC